MIMSTHSHFISSMSATVSAGRIHHRHTAGPHEELLSQIGLRTHVLGEDHLPCDLPSHLQRKSVRNVRISEVKCANCPCSDTAVQALPRNVAYYAQVDSVIIRYAAYSSCSPF